MGKRRRSSSVDPSQGEASADETRESYSTRLRPQSDLRQPNRLAYRDTPKKDKGKALVNGKSVAPKGGKKKCSDAKKRAAFQLLPAPDLYAANLFTWMKPPKFIENVAPIERVTCVVDAGGDSSAIPSCSSAVPSDWVCSPAVSKAKRQPRRDDRDANIFTSLGEEMRSILTRMYMECGPSNLGIPSWYWRLLRPCDRFLLLKRLFVVDLWLPPTEAQVINGIERPDFADAKKLIRNLKQLHVVFIPDPEATKERKIVIRAHLFEIQDMIRHPRKTRRFQEVKHLTVTVDVRNHGRLNICLAGDNFHLKLWTNEKDFSRFTGQYQREVFPSVGRTFRASACMEDSLTKDADYLASKRVSIRKSFQEMESDSEWRPSDANT